GAGLAVFCHSRRRRKLCVTQASGIAAVDGCDAGSAAVLCTDADGHYPGAFILAGAGVAVQRGFLVRAGGAVLFVCQQYDEQMGAWLTPLIYYCSANRPRWSLA